MIHMDYKHMEALLLCWMLSERSKVHIPAREEICIEISAPSAPPSQLSYDEYTDRTLAVVRRDGD